jgi:hypothetical protein
MDMTDTPGPLARAWLVSAAPGDLVPGGTDIALLDGLSALSDPDAGTWMTEQGYGPDDPEELMYLTPWEPPAGLPSREVPLTGADRQLLATVVENRLREYAELQESRPGLVWLAHALGVNKRQIALLAGVSRQTVYHDLGERPGVTDGMSRDEAQEILRMEAIIRGRSVHGPEEREEIEEFLAAYEGQDWADALGAVYWAGQPIG